MIIIAHLIPQQETTDQNSHMLLIVLPPDSAANNPTAIYQCIISQRLDVTMSVELCQFMIWTFPYCFTSAAI